jgi:hypothetical protein
VYGDRTVKISVTNAASGTASNSLALRVIAKWMANEN